MVRKQATKRKLVQNPKSDPYYKRGFTHRVVSMGGGFLYVHKSRAALVAKRCAMFTFTKGAW